MTENCSIPTCHSISSKYSNSSDSLESELFFDNLIWLTSKEAALYLRKSLGAIHILVSRGQLRARKFQNRLYFKKSELFYLLETSQFKGGLK